MSRLFHVFRLCATRLQQEQKIQDLFSQLAYATSLDLQHFNYHQINLVPPEQGTSIWSGSTLHIHDRYHLFYTQRRTTELYWADQVIKASRSVDLEQWQMVDLDLSIERVDPEERYFQRLPKPGDRTIHAWRDPYVFLSQGSVWMLVAAKSLDLPQYRNGCIALLKAKDPDLTEWELIYPAVISGFEELEMPQIYWDIDTQQVVIVASTWDNQDYRITQSQGYQPLLPDPSRVYRSRGYLLGFEFGSFDDLVQGKGLTEPKILLWPQEQLYAGVIVPELSGSVIGFDITTGQHRLLGSRFPSFRHLS
jgi:beta-fructofuranosidase